MIKIDISIPKTCKECFASTFYECDFNCEIEDKDVTDYAYENEKPDWCPIKEVQE